MARGGEPCARPSLAALDSTSSLASADTAQKEETMEAQAQEDRARHDRARALLAKFAGHGAVWTSSGDVPLGAHCGHALVVRVAPRDADAAEVRAALATASGWLAAAPERNAKDAARVLLAAQPVGESVALARSTEPDAALREATRSRLEEAVEQAAAWQRKTGAKAARQALHEAAATLRRLDHPAAHGLRVGPSVVDLRLVRRCLVALGGAPKGAVLFATSENDAFAPVALGVPQRGVGLVMPLRTGV